jgi:hypothetical protein
MSLQLIFAGGGGSRGGQTVLVDVPGGENKEVTKRYKIKKYTYILKKCSLLKCRRDKNYFKKMELGCLFVLWFSPDKESEGSPDSENGPRLEQPIFQKAGPDFKRKQERWKVEWGRGFGPPYLMMPSVVRSPSKTSGLALPSAEAG